MPTNPRDAEDTMCQQLLNLDLRDQNRVLVPLSLAMKTPGYMGPPGSSSAPFSSSLSSLSQHAELMDAFLPSSHWGQKPDSPQPPTQQPTSVQSARSRFWAKRSLSMVETGSAGGPLGWPYLGVVGSSLSTSPTLPSCSSASSLLSAASSSSGSSSSSSSRYKTELCRSFAESSVCKYGNKCQFAHGLDELRDLNRHPKYKTEPCRTFHTIGFCPYGIRCHFVHNNEDDDPEHPRCSSATSSPPCGLSQAGSLRPGRPPLLLQSFSFAGFPSAPHPQLQHALPTLPPPSPGSYLRAPPSAAPPSCTDITELLSHALLEMDSAFEASVAQHHLHPQQPPPPAGLASSSSSDPRAHFLPSPDSGCSLSGFSTSSTSPSLRQSPGVVAGGFAGPLGARSLSSTSLSEPEHDDDDDDDGGGGGSSASSLSGSNGDGSAQRLAVFSQMSVLEDTGEYVL